MRGNILEGNLLTVFSTRMENRGTRITKSGKVWEGLPRS